jgi:hypothetical protein
MSVDVKRARMLIVDQPTFEANQMQVIFTLQQSAESSRSDIFWSNVHFSREVYWQTIFADHSTTNFRALVCYAIPKFRGCHYRLGTQSLIFGKPLVKRGNCLPPILPLEDHSKNRSYEPLTRRRVFGELNYKATKAYLKDVK